MPAIAADSQSPMPIIFHALLTTVADEVECDEFHSSLREGDME